MSLQSTRNKLIRLHLFRALIVYRFMDTKSLANLASDKMRIKARAHKIFN